MGREQRRREEKRNKNKIADEEVLDTSIKGTTILKVVSSIVLILFVVYYIMAVFITKEIDISDKNSKTNTTESNSSSITTKILGANIFSQKEETYYVYCYDFNDEDSGVAQAISGVSDKTVYKLDTSSGMNSKYVSETGNPNSSSLDDLKVSNPTLLVISGDKITGYYEGRNSIMNFLSS